VIHVRTDDEELNSKRRFACGIGPALPEGDLYFFLGEDQSYRHADCPACRAALEWPARPPKLGTSFSEMTPARFVEIARSWGYD
jgi:hypothetical protein